MIKALRFIRRYLKTMLILLWLCVVTYGVMVGKIDLNTLIEKITTDNLLSLLLGAS